MKLINKALILITVGIAVLAMSVLTNLSGIVIPFAEESMNLNLSKAGILPFAFFIAYAVMSIPAGILHEKFSAKLMMVSAFLFTSASILTFIILPYYFVFLICMFIAGAGMSVVQVVINPVVKDTGGVEYFSFYLIAGQLIYGGGSIASPLLFSYLMSNHSDISVFTRTSSFIVSITPSSMPWISIYWFCLFACIVALISLISVRFPKIELASDHKIGGFKALFELIKDFRVWVFFLGIFSYAGAEQGLANWMTKFLEVYHNMAPDNGGALVLSRFWLCLSLGGLFGVLLIFLSDVKKILGAYSIISILLVIISLFGETEIVQYTFPLCGLFFAIMYPSILSLGMNTITVHPGALSGILCTGISGAAFFAFIIGFLGDFIGLKTAMCITVIALLFILFIAVWAKPIIKNKQLYHSQGVLLIIADSSFRF